MTADDDLDRRIASLAGTDWWNVPSSPGVPALKVTDGPSGARGELFAGGPPSVSFPCGAALGATWDVDLVERVGAALGAETRAKGAHVLLGPTVNLQRSPLGGRHFECFSEDPVLAALLAAAYVTGLQSTGVAACVKHLVANDVEADRFEISSEPDDRTLREVALLPFEHTLTGVGAWSTMGAYNRLHGTHCCEHSELLTTILRDEWGWDGVVISDWFATRSTAPAALAGLDLEMPGPAIHWGPKLVAAVEAGEVPAAVIEAKRARLAVLAARTGAESSPPGADGPGGAPGVVALAREAAASAVVLLRNAPVGASAALPLEPEIGSVAVLGPSADREVIQGGGSARVTPTDVTTVADGLRARLGERATVGVSAPASRGTPPLDGRDLRRADGSAGVDVEVRDDAGGVRATLRPRDFRVVYLDTPAPGEETTGWSIEASARFRPRRSGVHRFTLRTNAEATLRIDGDTVIADAAGGAGRTEIDLLEGAEVALSVVCRTDEPGLRVTMELRCGPPEPPDALEHDVALAAAADAAVVVVGLDGDWETEGRDREDLSLPGRQVELIRAVAAAQPRTVVVVLAGSPVDLSWAGDVPTVLWCWYPGQEGGHAIADVLLGDVDPGGRLPCTMPRRIEDTPAFLDVPPEPGVLRYQEGVFCGHRWYDARLLEPAFPFGHGLSYTTFEIGPPTVSRDTIDAGGSVEVEVEVTNTGPRRGSEVVQLYVADADAPVRRPPRELRGFAKVVLEPGETRTVRFLLEMRDFAYWDRRAHGWRADAGLFAIHTGRSSRDLRGIAEVALTVDWTSGP